MSTDDRRKHRRELISPHLKVVAPDSEQSFGAFITNISGGGVEVYSDSRLEQGQNVDLYISFETDPKTGKDEIVKGHVRWVKLFGSRFLIGIAFKDININDHPILSGFLDFVSK
ncbi:MAG: PilZ domain-containing protein [Nitrospirota bacterium]